MLQNKHTDTENSVSAIQNYRRNCHRFRLSLHTRTVSPSASSFVELSIIRSWKASAEGRKKS